MTTLRFSLSKFSLLAFCVVFTVLLGGSAKAQNLAQIAAGNFASLPGLKAWYRAGVGVYKDAAKTQAATLDGDLVYTWADQSGSGKDLSQATAATRPALKLGVNGIGGTPALSFSGSQHLDISALLDSTYASSITVYVVSRINLNQGLDFVLSSNANGFGIARGSGAFIPNTLQVVPPAGSNYSTISSSVYSAGPSFPVIDDEQQFTIQVVTYNGVTATVDGNFHPKSSPSTTAFSAAGAFSVGSRSIGDFNFNGNIAEVVICNQAHSAALRVAVEQALLTRYPQTLLKELVSEGDSITAGAGGTSYAQLFANNFTAGTYFVELPATPGTTLLQMLARGAATVDPYFVSSRPRNIVSIMGGTNDLSDTSSTPVADGDALYARLVNYCNLRRAAGWRMIVVTMLPRYTVGGPFNQTRAEYNSKIRAGWQDFADGIADVGNDPNIGQDGQNTNTTYYNADGTHPNTTGEGIIEGYLQQAIQGGTIYASNVSQPGVDNALFAGTTSVGVVSSTTVSIATTIATGQTGTVTYQMQRAANVLSSDTLNTYNAPSLFANITGASLTTAGTLTDSTVSPGILYWYRVKATDAGSGLVNYSNLVQATATAATIPTSPTGTASTTGQIPLTVTWQIVSGATHYRLYRSLSSGAYTILYDSVNLSGANTDTQYTDNVAVGSSVSYRVSAYNGGGESSQASPVTGVTGVTNGASIFNLPGGQIKRGR